METHPHQFYYEMEIMGESERESERECDGEEGEDSATIRRRRKESSFAVESKVFEIVLDERKGKP